MWLKMLFTELHLTQKPLAFRCDNQGAIALAQNPISHPRTKHIALQHHFIRHAVASKFINISYCPTDDMVADICTKSLGPIKHHRFVSLLGLDSSSSGSIGSSYDS
jgi:hypothetical protein